MVICTSVVRLRFQGRMKRSLSMHGPEGNFDAFAQAMFDTDKNAKKLETEKGKRVAVEELATERMAADEKNNEKDTTEEKATAKPAHVFKTIAGGGGGHPKKPMKCFDLVDKEPEEAPQEKKDPAVEEAKDGKEMQDGKGEIVKSRTVEDLMEKKVIIKEEKIIADNVGGGGGHHQGEEERVLRPALLRGGPPWSTMPSPRPATRPPLRSPSQTPRPGATLRGRGWLVG